MKLLSTTDLIRRSTVWAFVAVVLGVIVGWFTGRDPSEMLGILGVIVTAMGVGEASNVGKRATTKVELLQ